MKTKYASLIVGLVVGLLSATLVLLLARPDGVASGDARPQAIAATVGSGFTYQGHLMDGGIPANALYDFEFMLYDAAVGGAQVGSTVTLGDVSVSDGLFTVELDFDSTAFGSDGRWLQIGVRPGSSSGSYTGLSPRQELTPAPYALALPNVHTDEDLPFVGVGRNFRISGNEVFGVRYEGDSDEYGGMYVETSHAGGWPFYGYATAGSFRAWTYYNGNSGDWRLYNSGVRLTVPNEGGLRISSSADYSLVISNTVGSDGIRIYDTGDDGIQIGSDPDYPNYGVYIPSPGVSTYGLWPNTANASGEWALYTVDNIEAGNVTFNSLSLVAKVAGPETLVAGDVVAVIGAAEALPGGHQQLPLVQPADDATLAGIIGVVESRMVWETAPGKEEGSLHSADGPAQSGDYVSLTVFGVAEVRIDPSATITAGQRLTAADRPGYARPLQTRTIDGMVVSEGTPVIGIALAAPAAGQDTILVFVTLR